MAIYNYLRVSTDDQNCGSQRQILEYRGGGGEFFEEIRSGRDVVNRPVLRSILARLRPGDVLRVTSVDRIARSVVEAHSMAQQITSMGATLEIVGQGLSFAPDEVGNPIQKITFTILAAFAEFERAIIRERQAQGYAAIRSGLRPCKGKRRYHSQRTIKEIFRDVLECGLSYRKTAAKHGLPLSTVHYIVKKVRPYGGVLPDSGRTPVQERPFHAPCRVIQGVFNI